MQLTLRALNPWVASVADWASTAGRMQSRLADGVSAARFHVAGIAARAVNTLVRVGALKVRLAGWSGCH